MSDSPPLSTWGPAPYDDRDLDAVLSGETAGVPEALLPVAGALAALRAAPAPAELAGEAAARALFREHAAAVPAERARAVRSPAGGLIRRIPPARAADDRPRPRPHSHRQRRHPAGRRRWQAVALLGGAAAAAAACAAYAGVFSGPGGQHAVVPGRGAATLAQAPATGGAKPPVLAGGGSKEPSPTPTPAGGQGAGAPQPGGQALCQAYSDRLKSPATRWDETAQDDYWRLSQLAHSPDVWHYCAEAGVRLPAVVPYTGGHSAWSVPVYRDPGDRGGAPGGHSGFGSAHGRGGPGFGGGH